MTPDELPFLLRASRADATERGPDCPDEHALAAYVDGVLGPDAREPLELHLADCSYCLALIGLLSREAEPRSRRRWFVPPQWAAAAAVAVLAVTALVRLSQPTTTADAGWQSDVPATRNGSAPSLRLLSPGEGKTVDRQELAVRWAAVPGARYYDVRVVTDTGDVVAEEHVTGTEWRPKSETALRPGLDYFVYVDAYVSEGNAIGSEHVSFRVSE